MPGVEDAEQHVEQACHANGEDGEQHGHAERERLDAEQAVQHRGPEHRAAHHHDQQRRAIR